MNYVLYQWQLWQCTQAVLGLSSGTSGCQCTDTGTQAQVQVKAAGPLALKLKHWQQRRLPPHGCTHTAHGHMTEACTLAFRAQPSTQQPAATKHACKRAYEHRAARIHLTPPAVPCLRPRPAVLMGGLNQRCHVFGLASMRTAVLQALSLSARTASAGGSSATRRPTTAGRVPGQARGYGLAGVGRDGRQGAQCPLLL
jgi:hypothetical protein